MKTESDLSRGTPDPYAKLWQRRVTTRLDAGAVDHFKGVGAEAELCCQRLTKVYLRDRVAERRKLALEWWRIGGSWH